MGLWTRECFLADFQKQLGRGTPKDLTFCHTRWVPEWLLLGISKRSVMHNSDLGQLKVGVLSSALSFPSIGLEVKTFGKAKL